MNSDDDRIPTWVGRAVTTTELSQVLQTHKPTVPGRSDDDGRPHHVEPTNASRHTPIKTADDNDAATVPAAVGPRAVESNTGQSVLLRDTESTSTGRPSGGSSKAGVIGVLAAIGLVVVAGVLILTRLGDSLSDTTIDFGSAISADGEDGQPAPATGSSDEASPGDIAPDGAAPGTAKGSADRSVEEGDGETSPSMVVSDIAAATFDAHYRAALDDGQSAWAVYADGRIYLQGTVPDSTTAETLSSRLQTQLGSANVINQFVVDPSVPAPTDPPLFIKETVVFAPDSADMPPGSDWILVVAEVLMNRYDETDLTVVANGEQPSAGITAELQRERVEAIVAYLRTRGVDGSRLDIEFRPDVRFGADTGNKPIEFVVRGLLHQVGNQGG